MEKLRVGIIGLGQRATKLMKQVFINHKDIYITALCDTCQDRIDEMSKLIAQAGGKDLFKTTDYKKLLSKDIVDCVVIAASWGTHIEMSIDCMDAGIPCACEIGGCESVDECFALVDAYERTKTPFMFMENCCYGRYELMVLNMVKKGIFGELVHCSGGYHHDLRSQISSGDKEDRSYRLCEYLNRNCENYPTHEIGPIARVLDINRGNRFISLTSTSSKSCGLHEYITSRKPDDDELVNAEFAQGDIVTTVIKCERGETVVMTLDTTLPLNFYTRGFTVRGTKAMFEESTRSLYIDTGEQGERDQMLNNADEYFEKYDHEIWKNYLSDGDKNPHEGMSYLVYTDFFGCVKNNKPMPIDVYDAAAWMCITPLSAQSIVSGSAPVAIPDFKNRKK